MNLPSSPALSVAVVPSGSVTVTVAPGSASPLMESSPSLTGFTFGAVVVSLAVISVLVGSETFLPGAVAVVLTLSLPSAGAGTVLPSSSFTVKLPSLSAVPVALVPSGSSTTTSAFGSVLPVISVSPSVTALTVGFLVVFTTGVTGFGFAVNFRSIVSEEPSGYLTVTGIVASVFVLMSAFGVTDTSPVVGSTLTVQPSGIFAVSGISKVVSFGRSLSVLTGTFFSVPAWPVASS